MLNNEALRFTLDALWLVVLLSAPPVIVAALLGLLIAFIQAATQIQEQTFQYAVKFFAIVITIFVTASLLGGTLFHYTDRLMNEFPAIVKRR
jgi:type III secretion protein S